MRITLVVQSLLSDWSQGGAGFLRGVVEQLEAQSHPVDVLESDVSELAGLDLDDELRGADVVIVHDSSAAALIRAVGEHHARHGDYALLFHDTLDRIITAPDEVADLGLDRCDAVLAAGGVIRDAYLDRGWARRAYTWHEAADTDVFRPVEWGGRADDLVWIGEWGDGDRPGELSEFLLEPARALGLSGCVHGAGYPREARAAVAASGLRYEDGVPSHRLAETFAGHRVTVHIPRREYARRMPGVPGTRVFEALACGIPLVCAPWEDRDALFRQGVDYLVARDAEEMKIQIRTIVSDPDTARELAANGLERIADRHTCAHRADELLKIVAELG